MRELVQLIYVSRATFELDSRQRGIEPAVAQILRRSRVNNRRDGLTGVLCFGDGCFFQCLEGEAEMVDALYARIQHDDRHCEVKQVLRKPIAHVSFSDWSMKYVVIEKALEQFLIDYGHTTFDPYLFDIDTTEALLARLRSTNSTEPPASSTEKTP